MRIERRLTEDQIEVVWAWMASLTPALAELYGSLDALLGDDTFFPGRARLVGHCIREIRSNLREHFVGRKSAPLDYPKELDAIASKVREEAGGAATIPDSPPAITAGAAKMFWDLIDRSGATSGNARPP